MSYTVGLLLGVLAGGATGVFLVALLFKLRVLDQTFDERQERARGRAFARGFTVMAVSIVLYGLSDLLFDHWADTLAGCILCVCAGAVAFAVSCIRQDAYLSLRERPRQVVAILAVFSGFNLALSAYYLYDGTLMEYGTLTFRAANLFAGLACAAVLAVYAARRRSLRAETEEE